MTSPDDLFVLRVDIVEGKGFGFEVQALHCIVTFGGENKETPFSVAKDTHVWSSSMQWRVTRAQLRRLSANGQSHAKVVVRNRDSDKQLGWLILDTRKAKLNPQYSDPDGEWMSLTGPVSTRDTPQVHVYYELVEEVVKDSDAEAAVMNQLDSTLAGPMKVSGPVPASAPAGTPKVRRSTGGSQKAAGSSGHGSGYSSGFEAASPETNAQAGPLDPDPDQAKAQLVGSGGGGSSGAGGSGSGNAAAASSSSATAAVPGHTLTTIAPSAAPGVQFRESAAAPDGSSYDDAALGFGRPAQQQGGHEQEGRQQQGQQQQGLPRDAAAAGAEGGGSPRRQLYQRMQARPAPSQADGPFRHFVLSIELRSFQAGIKLPLNMCSTYVQALLPPEVLELVIAGGGRPPSRMMPLRTFPPMDIARGAEGMLQNGCGSLEFVAGVMELARVLGDDPHISLEVWHKERFRSDTLLGLASVPLAPLLHDCWVDGYAPVQALMVTPGAPGQAQREEQVQVGMVRAIVALESPAPADMPQPYVPPSSTAVLPAQPGYVVPMESAAWGTGAAAGVAGRGDGGERMGAGVAGRAGGGAGRGGGGAGRKESTAAGAAAGRGGGGTGREESVAVLAAASAASASVPPEYQVAWELEVWKRAEEARWRAELREREAARMSALESEWRRREKLREAEVSAVKVEYAAVEDKARKMLAVMEERERRLVLGEESVMRRRRELERDHTARMMEAEAAVRRLQVECEHQLEIERDRSAEVMRQKQAQGERLAVTEARYASLEQAFASFRDAHRSSDEAVLHRQLLEARDAASRAEERAGRALRAKGAYKLQVTKLAEQLAQLYKKQQQRAVGGGWQPGLHRMLDQQPTQHPAGGSGGELADLRQQLLALKAAALAQVSPPGGNSPSRGNVSGARVGAGASAVQEPDDGARGSGVRAQPEREGNTAWITREEGRGSPVALRASADRSVEASILPSGISARVSSPPQHRPAGDGGQRLVSAAAPSRLASSSSPPPLRPAKEGTDALAAPGDEDDTRQAARQDQSSLSPAWREKSVAREAGLPQAVAVEVVRLLSRRAELLATGAYDDDDPLLLRIQARVEELRAGGG